MHLVPAGKGRRASRRREFQKFFFSTARRPLTFHEIISREETNHDMTHDKRDLKRVLLTPAIENFFGGTGPEGIEGRGSDDSV